MLCPVKQTLLSHRERQFIRQLQVWRGEQSIILEGRAEHNASFAGTLLLPPQVLRAWLDEVMEDEVTALI